MTLTRPGLASRLRSTVVGLCAVFLEDSCVGCAGPLSQGFGLLGPLCVACVERLGGEAGERCASCSLPLASLAGDGSDSSDSLCLSCSERPATPLIVAPREHRGLARDLVCAFKYQGRRELAEDLARATLEDEQAREAIAAADLLVPAPTSPLRRRRRGFCQAELFARALSDRWAVLSERRVRVASVLRRRRGPAPQVQLGARERSRALRASMYGAFRAGRRVRGRRVLLIDDVVTTGATSREACRVLRDLGAEGLVVLACTRTAAPSSAPRLSRDRVAPKADQERMRT